MESWASVVTAPGYLSVDFLFFVDLGEEKEKEIRSFEEDQAANVEC